MDTKTTKQVAAELGISYATLGNYLCYNRHLRPASRLLKAGPLSWTDEEIEALRQARASGKLGRPKK